LATLLFVINLSLLYTGTGGSLNYSD
jgi:hypothetical protein